MTRSSLPADQPSFGHVEHEAGAAPGLTLAICAYNEAANIRNLLESLLADPVASGAEVLVVSSASTDRTDAIVAEVQGRDTRVRLITEPVRRGKVAAVNIALQEARGQIVYLIDADCLPAPGALMAMLAHFENARVGGVGSRNLPVNRRASVVAGAAALMWDLHHHVCLRAPVLGGDVVAFRKLVDKIGPGVNDDFLIEEELRREGLEIAYAERALTRMAVPTTLSEFLRQRRRVYFGYLLQSRQGQSTKRTQRPALIFGAVLEQIRERPSCLPALGLLVVLDSIARQLALLDLLLGRTRDIAWEPAQTSKVAIER